MKEIIVITAEGCAGCEELKKRLEGSNRNIRILDVTKSVEAAQIVKDLQIDRVPTLITVDRTEEGTKLCMLDREKNAVKCVKTDASSLVSPQII